MRVEAERYRINDAVGNDGDNDQVSLGLVYRFGGSTPAPVAVAAAPMPEPVVVRPPAPTKVTFSADSMFDFDKDTVKPAGKQELDKFAADLSGSDYGEITVTGHTDRIGSHAYNMDLSARRAEAVKNYLVETGGIPAGKITAQGIDGAEPVTKPGDCVGNKATKELIACLQPDRRVEVEVSGTKQ
jgi:OOP family OmpA-OmpF porin